MIPFIFVAAMVSTCYLKKDRNTELNNLCHWSLNWEGVQFRNKSENVGVKHAKWGREAGYKVSRDCCNSYFYIVEDESLNVIVTFNIPNTICNECKNIDKRYLKACPKCGSENLDYLTRIVTYMKRVSNDVVFQEIPDERWAGTLEEICFRLVRRFLIMLS